MVGERGRGVKIGRPRSGGGRILDVDGQVVRGPEN